MKPDERKIVGNEPARMIPIAVLRILFEHWALNHVIAG